MKILAIQQDFHEWKSNEDLTAMKNGYKLLTQYNKGPYTYTRVVQSLSNL
jgi:hypothetical protein